jgi:predicted secreted protein
MKKVFVFGLVSALLLPLMVAGCKADEPTNTEVPPLNGGQEAVTIELSCDDFAAQNNITRDVDIVRPGSLIVSLCSNGTTGYQWDESANISAPSVIEQVSHTFVEPQASGGEPVIGAAGKDVRVFDSLEAGTATIKIGYSRPWEGGEKDAWTLTLNVTVR